MNYKTKALKVKGSILGIILLTVCYLLGCSQIRVTSVWVDPEFKGDGIDNVIVVGVSKDGGMRRIFEDEFISLFKQRGVNAIASYRFVSDDKLKDEKNLDRAVKESGSDTILMTRLIDIRKDTQYIPPDYVYAPPRHYHRGWHGYYNRAYMVSPGYTVEYETAVLETNVYDLRTDTLIWSARSDTPTSGNMGKHIRDFARAIIKQLAEARLIN